MEDKKEKILYCLKCGHSWKQRGKSLPKVCGLCKSPNWNKRHEREMIDLIIGKNP